MSRKLLITYTTRGGSTSEVAQLLGNEFGTNDSTEVDVLPIDRVETTKPYSAVVIGSPIIHGENLPAIFTFVKRNSQHLSYVPVAYFFSCLIVTRLNEADSAPFPVFIDPALQNTASTDKNHSLQSYLAPLTQETPHIKPVSVAFFKGKLDLKKLDMVSMMVMRMIMLFTTEIREGDFRNPDVMREWARTITPQLNG